MNYIGKIIVYLGPEIEKKTMDLLLYYFFINQYVLSRIMNEVYLGVQQLEVQYSDIVNKPDFFRKIDMIDYTRYQLSTKAKE